MAVSYVSKTFRNTPYVPPVDLDLMAKVLGQEQAGFDQNALKIQSQINDLNSLDVAKDEDRDYLHNKINSLVSNLNNLGGVDLGDSNVLNQIESYGADIYNDDSVINAISSTKKIRNLQATYDKMRSDPKLSKYFSDANYTLDMAAVQNYMSDGQVGSSYQGNSSATPFYDYNKEFFDVFNKKVANEYSHRTPDGYYIRKEDGKYIAADEVAAEARGLMSGNARAQMKRDAAYLYKYQAGWGKDQVIDKALQVDVQSLNATQAIIDKTNSDIALEKDPKNKLTLQNNLKSYQTILTQQTAQLASSKAAYSRLYDQDPSELMYKGFSDDYFKALGLRFSYNQVKNDIVADPVKAMIFNAGERRALKQAEIDAAYNIQKLRDSGASERLILEYQLKAGLKGIDKTGAIFDIQPNTDTGKEEDYYKAAQDRLNNQIPKEIDSALDDYWSKLVAGNLELQRPEFGYVKPNTNPPPPQQEKGFLDKTDEVGSNISNSINNFISNTLLGKDYKGTTSSTESTNKPTPSINYDINKDGRVNIEDFQLLGSGKHGYDYVLLNPNAKKIIADAVTALENKAAGKPTNIAKLPEGTSDLVLKLKLYDQEKSNLSDAINKYNAGDQAFLRNQYGSKIIADNSEIQTSIPIGLIKSYIKSQNIEGLPPSFAVTEVGKNTAGYVATIKGEKGAAIQVPITPELARTVGLEAGPYDILNTTVTKNNPFTAPIENQYGKFAVNLQVYRNGNKSNFVPAYLYSDENGNTQLIPIPNIPPQISAAGAFDAGKTWIETWGQSVPDKTSLKKLFDEYMLKNR